MGIGRRVLFPQDFRPHSVNQDVTSQLSLSGELPERGRLGPRHVGGYVAGGHKASPLVQTLIALRAQESLKCGLIHLFQKVRASRHENEPIVSERRQHTRPLLDELGQQCQLGARCPITPTAVPNLGQQFPAFGPSNHRIQVRRPQNVAMRIDGAEPVHAHGSTARQIDGRLEKPEYDSNNSGGRYCCSSPSE